MKKVLFFAMLLGGMLASCTNSNKQTTDENMEQELELTQEWDKVFPLSEKVSHKKVTFKTQYGLILAADMYTPKDVKGKLAAIAVSGPFGAVKEQSSGLYAMKMAERGFVTLAFDPSYTGESSGEPRRTASPDINTEDFMAAVDFLSKQENVDAEKIGIIGICGWGGIALNAAAADTRIKATVASTMYDMTRVSGNDYNDAFDVEEARHTAREKLSKQRLDDPMAMAGGVLDTVPPQAPRFVHDYYDYYKTERGYHIIISVQETRTTVGASLVHRHIPTAVSSTTSTKSDIPDASHCDLYDGGYTELVGKGEPKNMIPWDKLEEFFKTNLKSF